MYDSAPACRTRSSMMFGAFSARRYTRRSSRAMSAWPKRRPTASRCCSTIISAPAAKPISSLPPRSSSASGGCVRRDADFGFTRRRLAMAVGAQKTSLGRGLASLIGDRPEQTSGADEEQRSVPLAGSSQGGSTRGRISTKPSSRSSPLRSARADSFSRSSSVRRWATPMRSSPASAAGGRRSVPSA